MDTCNHHHSSTAISRRLLILLSLLVFLATGFVQALAADPFAAWDHDLTQSAAHPFAPIVPFQASYRFGWEGLSAGGATVQIAAKGPDRRGIIVQGGPNALIRRLWPYQALYIGEAGINGEFPSWFHLAESQSSKALISDASFKQGSVLSCHRLLTEKKPWKHTELPEVRDLFASMLFVRSQPLNHGDKLRLVVFPDENPYLVDLTVSGREPLMIQGKSVPAIRFSLRMQSIETREANKGHLSPHRKFHSGSVWISDDALRLPLRAEVEIFIGSVFAEIESWRVLKQQEQ